MQDSIFSSLLFFLTPDLLHKKREDRRGMGGYKLGNASSSGSNQKK
jgi:hypothetical protein